MARICVISKSHLPFDARVVREAHALTEAGHEVDVICGQMNDQPFRERNGRLTIYRLPIARRRGSPLRYAFEFVTFQIGAALLVAWLHLRHPYRVVETTTLPDWLVFAAFIPRLLGARVLLDMHDPAPEYDMTKYGLEPRHPSVRVLAFLEQASIRFATFVTTCSEQMRERYIERGAPPEKIDVVLNSFDEERYVPHDIVPAPRDSEAFVLVTHGTIEPNYGLDVAIRAVGLLADRIPGLRLEIYGDGTHRAALQRLTRELGLERHVWFSETFRPMEEVLPRIAAADLGLVVVRRDAFRDITLCIKMFDYISMHTPVVISRTRAVDAYFGDDCLRKFASGDVDDLARAIHDLYRDPEQRRALARRATAANEPYRWVHQRRRYVGIVEALAAGEPALDRHVPLLAEARDER